MVWVGPGIRSPVKTDSGQCGLCLTPGPLLLSTPGLSENRKLGYRDQGGSATGRSASHVLDSSVRLDAKSIIYGFPKSLLTSQILLSRLHGHMAEQELDLVQFAARLMTEPGTRSPEVVWCEFRYAQPVRVLLHNVPDHFLGNLRSPNSTCAADASENLALRDLRQA